MKRNTWIVGLAVLGGIGWYAFRPELLFVRTHVDEAMPGRVHRVIYEQMVDNSEGEIRSLLDYCGLDWDEACLRFHETKRPVRTASSEQVRRPLSRSGFGQWIPFEQWLGPLKDALGPALTGWDDAPRP